LKGALDECNEKKVLVLTHRDIYANNSSKNDDWIFGYCSGNLTLASTARMKRFDSQPSSVLEVPEELYFRRLETLAIHEIGHGVVRAPHLQLATWVNAQSGGELWLGMHCTDNTCVMYEVWT
jgi:predicted Zn-dependent protease